MSPAVGHYSIHLSFTFVIHAFSDVVPVKKAGFGSGDSRPILLDNVACDGSEKNISQCAYDSVTNCDHSEVAGVICGGT